MPLPHGRPLLALALLLSPLAAAAADAPTDLLGDPLPQGAVARWGTIRLRHGGAIGALAFAPDGKTIASGGYDNDVYLWQADNGRQRRRLTGHAGAVRALAFAADGKRLASGGDDKTVRVWDADTGKELHRLDGHALSVLAVAFAPDGKTLASAGGDYVVRVWDTATGKERYKLEGHDSGINALAFSPDGKALASAGDDNTVRLWDAAKGKELYKLTGHDDLVLCVAFSPDGKLLASGSKDETVRVWDVGTGKEWQKVKTRGDGKRSPAVAANKVMAVAFAADGKSLATVSSNEQVARWDAASGKSLGEFDTHDTQYGDATAAALCAGGTRAAAGNSPGFIGLWDAATGKALVPAGRPGAKAPALAFTPDGKSLALPDGSGSVLLLDPATAKEQRRLKAGDATALAFSPDGTVLAVGAIRLREGEQIALWDAGAGKPLRVLPGLSKEITGDLLRSAPAFTPDGKLVVGPVSRLALRVWDAATGKDVRTIPLEVEGQPPLCFALSPDGRTVAAAYADKQLRLWDAGTGLRLRQWDGNEEATTCLTFSPDGRLLAAAGKWPVVTVWEVLTGKEVAAFEGHKEEVTALAFHPAGRALASGSADRSVRVWDMPSWKETARFTGHLGPVTSLAFAPDGKRLASASDDGTALVWDAARLTERKPRAEAIDPKGLNALWADLGGDDAAKAYRAIWALAEAPKEAVPLVVKQVRPVPGTDAKQLAKLIADLDDDEFDVREKATKALIGAGEGVEELVRGQRKRAASEEVRQRLGRVLEELDKTVALPGRRALPARALLVLEQAATPEARQALEKIGAGAPGAWLTREAKAALARLDRR